MGSDTTDHSAGTRGTSLELEVWHPDCWTLEETRDVDAGLIVRGLYTIEGDVHARFTAYGDSSAAVETLVDLAGESELTGSVRELQPKFEARMPVRPPGRATRELLVEYPEQNSIYEPFISRGFVPDGTIEIRSGREYWPVVFDGERQAAQRQLDSIRDSMDAEISVRRVGTPDAGARAGQSPDVLTPRQREVLRFAFERGYYEWPREVDAKTLADELGIAKATMLEHLRKAEGKVLNAYGIDDR